MFLTQRVWLRPCVIREAAELQPGKYRTQSTAGRLAARLCRSPARGGRMEQFSPSPTVPNPCVHRRMKSWSLPPSVQPAQTPGELAALSLGDCISMPTYEGFSSFIKTVRAQRALEKTQWVFSKLESSTDKRLSNLWVIYPRQTWHLRAVC